MRSTLGLLCLSPIVLLHMFHCELKASYLLHFLGVEIFQIISHCGWPKETFENYHILTEALRQKFGKIEPPFILRENYSLLRVSTDSLVPTLRIVYAIWEHEHFLK